MKDARLLLLALGFFSYQADAEVAGHFKSGETQVALVELYTSQGCSSCPPAEAWLGRLKEHDGLWTRVVPVAFHVDYWDRLGWPDPFASSRFTQRQRQFAARFQEGRVYTPNFAVNGREWRGFFRGEQLDIASAAKPGILEAKIESGRIAVHFSSSDTTSGLLEANWAVLAVDLSTAVRAGENSGKKLPQDFVALGHEVAAMERAEGSYRASGSFAVPAVGGRLALAVWVTRAGSTEPLQAVGGWLQVAGAMGAVQDSLLGDERAVY